MSQASLETMCHLKGAVKDKDKIKVKEDKNISNHFLDNNVELKVSSLNLVSTNGFSISRLVSKNQENILLSSINHLKDPYIQDSQKKILE